MAQNGRDLAWWHLRPLFPAYIQEAIANELRGWESGPRLAGTLATHVRLDLTHVPLLRNGTAKVKRMRLFGALFVVVVVILVGVPRLATAQLLAVPAPLDRHWFFVDVNLAGATSSLAEARDFTFKVLSTGEVATFVAGYPKPSDARVFPLTDISGGYMVGPHAGLGVGFSRSTFENETTLSATVPHPFFLATPGTGVGRTEPLKRTESATHFFVTLVPYSKSRTEWRFSLGATFFSYTADMVSSVTYSQNAVQGNPQNTVTVTGYTTSEAHDTTLGAHAGADFAYFIAREFAITGGGRYAVGTVELKPEPLSRIPQKIRVGDWRVFVGVRWRVGKTSQ